MKKALSNLKSYEKEALFKFLKAVRRKTGGKILEVRLFGSKFRGDYNKDSDIDIMMIVKERTDDLMDAVYDELVEIELIYDSKISLTIFSEKEYHMNIEAHTPFIENLQKEEIKV